MTKQKKENNHETTNQHGDFKMRIGYQDVTVTVLPGALQGCFTGMSNLQQGSIIVYQTESSIDTTNTLIHEILHCIVAAQGLVLDKEQEELIVNSLANGLTQVIRDNLEVFQGIINTLKRSSSV